MNDTETHVERLVREGKISVGSAAWHAYQRSRCCPGPYTMVDGKRVCLHPNPCPSTQQQPSDNHPTEAQNHPNPQLPA